MHRLVEEILLAGDEEDDEGHVDVVVAGLLRRHGAGVQRLQDRDHQLLDLGAGQDVAAELGVAANITLHYITLHSSP